MSDPPLLPHALADAARGMAARIAERLTDDQLVLEAVRRSVERAKYPFRWGGVSLYGGPSSLAVLFEYAARAEPGAAERWRSLARRRLRDATAHTHRAPLTDASTGNGTAGLAAAIGLCAEGQPGLRPTLRALHVKLAEQVLRMPKPGTEDGSVPGVYDTIQGMAGILGHLVSIPEPGERVRDAAHRLIDHLVWMCAPASDGDVHRRWRVPPEAFALPEDAEQYPHGYVNLGLAHGIPGPLAALNFAYVAGYRRPGLTEAMRHTADQLIALSESDRWGRNWPRILPLDAACRPLPRTETLGRAAWCYGAPGIGSTLLDTGEALGDPRLRSAALEGMTAELGRVRDGHECFDVASLCHGTAGVLAIAHKFAAAAPGRYRRSIADLTERLLDSCDPDLPVFVQQVHGGAPDVRLDSPGLLDGAAGVALTLWSVAEATDTRWQRALLIR